MNRKKKINAIHKKRMKKANAKLASNSKPKYVSKADREKLATEAQTPCAETAAPEATL